RPCRPRRDANSPRTARAGSPHRSSLCEEDSSREAGLQRSWKPALYEVHRAQPLCEQHQVALAEPLAVNGQLLDHLHRPGVETRDGGRIADGVDEAEEKRVGGGEDVVY